MSSEPRGEPAAHEASTQARASEPAATPNARSTASSAAGAPDGTDAKSTTKALETNGDDVKMHDAKDDDAKKTEPFSWL